MLTIPRILPSRRSIWVSDTIPAPVFSMLKRSTTTVVLESTTIEPMLLPSARVTSPPSAVLMMLPGVKVAPSVIAAAPLPLSNVARPSTEVTVKVAVSACVDTQSPMVSSVSAVRRSFGWIRVLLIIYAPTVIDVISICYNSAIFFDNVNQIPWCPPYLRQS